ncbi:uncharacterized protein PgNI_00028 [Pyricularia grisea]|uniref:Methyltransferase type 11 domain-containing protein n=1 Tax=Pyricularia grisea TaxID=148305 RepID=A0A6P8BLF7_PYRGI|nr:uncharacterized protein PgNI_00028 [Pyricularia grisea]TLD17442.1 hypothetical protein PgNI_00028 [Pyricularia grisea]
MEAFTRCGPAHPVINTNPALESYYQSLESRIGYKLVLGGSRHYEFYENGQSFPFPIGRALRRMEQKLFEALQLPEGSRVIDAGCGVAHVASYMGKKGLHITAFDVIDHHVSKARRNITKARLPEGQLTVQRMDYHHIETIPSASHDRLYTIETFLHSTDPEAVLAGVYRVLKPGGRIALFEYKHDLDDPDAPPGSLASDLKEVNKWAAMPTCQRSNTGLFEDIIREAGFENVEVRDYSEYIRPMLRLFYYMAIMPYFFVRLFGLQRFFINTMAGARGFVGLGAWRYVAITATKPDGEIEGSKMK